MITMKSPTRDRGVPARAGAQVRRVLLPVWLTAALALLLTDREAAAEVIFLEAGGRVVVEAEHFSSRTPDAVQRWLVAPDGGGTGSFANARGGRYVQALPDVGGLHGSVTQPPFIDYRLRISTPGRYQLYVRWDGLDGGSDSLFARVLELSDGPGGAVADWYQYSSFPFTDRDFATNPWQGEGGFESTTPGSFGTGIDTVWVVPAPGDYTLRFIMREDGVAIDAFTFQRTTLPPPTGIGPPESASVVIIPEPASLSLGALGALALLTWGRLRRKRVVRSPSRQTTLRVEVLEDRALLDTSALWGAAGELWSPQSRLPDFSFAGYHSGEASIPDVPAVVNVRDFGAVGDGVTDDSRAFVDAIDAAHNGAVLIPAGRYVIRRVLPVYEGNLVLRGEGPGVSTLYFPDPLAVVRGPGNAPQGTPFYSWHGGFVFAQGHEEGTRLAAVTSPALRGDTRLTLAIAAGIQTGQLVELFQTDPSASDHSLGRRLHADQPLSPDPTAGTRLYTDRFVSRVTAVEGNTLTLERPLRLDVELRWRPEVRVYRPSIQEFGVEGLTFEFPAVPYPGHQQELGYNGIQITHAANSWVRDVEFVNADNGIFLDDTRFTTVQNVSFSASAGRMTDVHAYGPSAGHHAIQARHSWDNLITQFDIAVPFAHDLTVEDDASGNVFAAGRGANLTLDHHGFAPFENLFTDLDLGAGTRTWVSGGGGTGKGHSGARETFWNLRADTPQSWPDILRAPDQLNFVGITTIDPTTLTPAGRWWEAIPPEELSPQNLYEAQLARRRGPPLPPPSPAPPTVNGLEGLDTTSVGIIFEGLAMELSMIGSDVAHAAGEVVGLSQNFRRSASPLDCSGLDLGSGPRDAAEDWWNGSALVSGKARPLRGYRKEYRAGSRSAARLVAADLFDTVYSDAVPCNRRDHDRHEEP